MAQRTLGANVEQEAQIESQRTQDPAVRHVQRQSDRISIQNRFWDGTEYTTANSQPSGSDRPSVASRSAPQAFSGKPSIAAASIIGIIAFAALSFLVTWYIRREKRARRARRIKDQIQDPFAQSSVTLAEDTSKALDDFLMKDIRPERSSLMFSRSRSPSITFVVDDMDRRNSMGKSGRKSNDTATNSHSKRDTLTRVSADTPRPSFIISELSSISQSNAARPASSSSGSATPRASVSPSVVPSTTRSSQLWTTTTGTTTENSSLLSCDPPSSRPSQSTSRSSNVLPSYASSLTRSDPSDASHGSSQLSQYGPPQTGVRLINDNGASQRNHARSLSQSSSNTAVSPATESASSSGLSQQLPSIPSTPSPLFRVSEY
ncbi:hypothetical protein N7462_000482 [Penicillium macrosclerotiorum]|uniref:uncharacterized protein n=1 Tax=Penicillium macrosclerotiorum TaxID=303699 RepID=UPI002546C6C2|nr:uncharacterized protein N7462_000482 [Penicillium macrosclerotiorum]KAJ5698477.1 hypothetical protein N7462_000482 [Penicillium macrosclerotiorum]